MCTCFTSSLFCEHQNLFTVPSDLPQDITDLILTATDIMSIERKAFQNMNRLQYLYLSGNKISTIRSKTFINTTVLELLYEL
ncbi:unnamed protein product [Oppiella nova]|uniref:Uncharacterized protein n=1 Tax=Oppiella nova TaxID=334625 RepID=A0A7R9MSF5_9ACAR|nr:unnamed protein product [Oppiella nova]CAG2182490.1 unnamed protein product [Oppiella nova]